MTDRRTQGSAVIPFHPDMSDDRSNMATSMDSNGMWIVGNKLYIGYEMVHNVDSLITLCQQMCQHLHNAQGLDNTELLLDYAKTLNAFLRSIQSRLSECTRELSNKRLKEMLIRCMERKSDLSPVLISSMEAYITSTTSVCRALAAQSRDSIKLHILETVKEFVLLLQHIKNLKPLPQVADLSEDDCLNIAQEWLGGRSTVVTNTGFDAIRVCITGGRTLAAMLDPTIDKGELLCLSSECELTTQQLEDMYQSALVSTSQDRPAVRDRYLDLLARTPQARLVAAELSKQLFLLREKMIEVLSRKILDDFALSEAPVEELGRAAVIVHYKPHRDQIFTSKLFRFEEASNIISSDVNMICHLHLINNLLKQDNIKYLLSQVNMLSAQLIWAAKLLQSNPYSDVLKEHFNLIKQLWISKLAILRGQVLSSANLRTYNLHKQDLKSYRSRAERASMSPTKQVKFVSSITVDPPVEPKPKVLSPTREPQPDWESADKDLVQAARKLAMIMVKLIQMVRGDACTRGDLIQSAKDIVRAADILTRLTQKLAKECTDRDIQLELLKLCERMPTFATQLKMLCTVKASTITGFESAQNPDGAEGNEGEATEMLLENARNLMQSVREAVKRAAAASINIRVAANQYIW